MKVVFKGNGKKEVLEVPFPGSRTVYFKVNEPVELSADEFKRIEKNIPEVFLVVPEKVEEVKEEKEPVVPEKVEEVKEEKEPVVPEKVEEVKEEKEPVVPEKVEEVKEEKEPVVPEKVEDNPEPVKTPKRKYKRKKGGNK